MKTQDSTDIYRFSKLLDTAFHYNVDMDNTRNDSDNAIKTKLKTQIPFFK